MDFSTFLEKEKEKLSIVLGQILPNRPSFKQMIGARPQQRNRFCTKTPARVKIRNKSPNQILPATNTLLRAPSMFLVFTNWVPDIAGGADAFSPRPHGGGEPEQSFRQRPDQILTWPEQLWAWICLLNSQRDMTALMTGSRYRGACPTGLSTGCFKLRASETRVRHGQRGTYRNWHRTN